MTKKIFRSSFLASVLSLLACFVLILGVLFGVFEHQLEKELESEAEYISYAVEIDEEKFFSEFSNRNQRVTLIAPDGTVLDDTAADAKEMENHSDRTEFQQAIKTGSGTGTRYSKTCIEKTVYYAKKLPDGNVLRVSTKQYTVVTIVLGLLQPLVYILLLALALSAYLSYRVGQSVLKPINEMNLDYPEECWVYDELAPFLHKIISQQRTIRSQLEEAKKKQKEFSLITENMREGFLTIDKNAQLLSCNTAALKLLDTTAQEGNVLTLNRTEHFRTAVGEVLEGKHAETMMHHEDCTYQLIANPVFEKKQVIGAVIVIIDITESVKRETIRREFTANVSHELKTPLTSISGFAELMRTGTVPEQDAINFSNTIYAEAQRLITLVNDIIHMSELEDNQVSEPSEPVSLQTLAKKITARLSESAKKKQVTLNVIGTDAWVYGVPRILDEMIDNLCDNAIKYNKENGSVTVETGEDQKHAWISVCDTGIGIPASQQERVFERFYRVDKSRSKKEGGTGLGLAIVKHGVMYHHAEISLESKVGEGTKITLTFPKKETE